MSIAPTAYKLPVEMQRVKQVPDSEPYLSRILVLLYPLNRVKEHGRRLWVQSRPDFT